MLLYLLSFSREISVILFPPDSLAKHRNATSSVTTATASFPRRSVRRNFFIGYDVIGKRRSYLRNPGGKLRISMLLFVSPFLLQLVLCDGIKSFGVRNFCSLNLVSEKLITWTFTNRKNIFVGMRWLKKDPQAAAVENTKKRQKKPRKPSPKKSSCKENIEPSVAKKEFRMHDPWNTCQRLNQDPQSIYEHLIKHRLTPIQLKMNHFPQEGYRPLNEVDPKESRRHCVRCGTFFDICKGVYLSGTECKFHPRKAVFSENTYTRLHECCNGPIGSPPCFTWGKHVTNQHAPRQLRRTSSKRHVRSDQRHRVYALDCEMSYTTDGMEVVRVCLVDLEGVAVYDFYVKPKNPVLDYNTMYSGVDCTHLQNCTVTLEDVQNILVNCIHEDSILVGHALNNDLAALGLIHYNVVDTSVLYPGASGKKLGLKHLASTYLNLSIQNSPSGHDCRDDARATMQLALLKVPIAVADPRPVVRSRQPLQQQEVNIFEALGGHHRREEILLPFNRPVSTVFSVHEGDRGYKVVFNRNTQQYSTIPFGPCSLYNQDQICDYFPASPKRGV